MDSKVTVFLIVMLLAILRGLMQRSKVRKEIEERKLRGLVSLKERPLHRRRGPVTESTPTTDSDFSDDDIESANTDENEIS